MPKTVHPPPRLAELTAEFFGGRVPERFTADTVREALARQIAQCHAMISLEFEECLSPPDDLYETYDVVLCARESAYERVDRLAGTIAALTAALLPRADDDVKRHAHYVTRREGGRGAAREVCELILSALERGGA